MDDAGPLESLERADWSLGAVHLSLSVSCYRCLQPGNSVVEHCVCGFFKG